MSPGIGEIVLPGEIVNNLVELRNVVCVGPGLRRHADQKSLIVTRAGTLKFKLPNSYWVDGHQKRYHPRKGDLVVGIVVRKGGDTLKVDIGSSELASLSTLAFEGATKKQKPDVNVGDAIYARLLTANREMEPELICVDSYFKAGKLGVLSTDGFIFSIGQELVHRLLVVENPLLRTLGKKTPYEIAIGMNGKVWVNARAPSDIATVMDTLYAAEMQTDREILNICRQIC